MRSRFVVVLLFLGATLPLQAYTISAWIPTWDPNALTTVQRHAGSMTESNPGWYTINADGSIGIEVRKPDDRGCRDDSARTGGGGAAPHERRHGGRAGRAY